ncbi:MAG TPA: acetate--CoA ligase family protein [Trebonia sp.]|nr:acetate--CoA ligase family protein [Trebonia sp.]
MSQATPHGLAAFRDPASVAVVGASDDAAKWGHWLARGALEGERRRRVYLVNTRARQVLDRNCFPSLTALPEVPELVAVAVPAAGLVGCVREAAGLGVPGLLAVTAGIDDDRPIRDALARSQARLIGPNCLGIYDASAGLALAWGRFVPGTIAVVSQSGQLGLEIAHLAEQAGLGISRFVSVGSQLDVTAPEVLEDLIGHEMTSVVALYLESFGDGARVLDVLTRLRQAGKQVLVLTVGGSEASRAAARSHTGSMTSRLDVVDAACRAAGAVRVDTPKQLVDAAALIVRSRLPAGRRTAIVTDSGGQGAIATDMAERNGLTVTGLPAVTRDALAGLLPAHASVANPVDLAGAGEQDVRVYGSVVATLAASGAVDAVVLTGYFGSYAQDVPSAGETEASTARLIAQAAQASGVPVIVHSMAGPGATIDVLHAHGVATYRDIDSAVGALRVARLLAEPPVAPASPRPAGATLQPASPGYYGARRLLAQAGVRFPPALLVPAGQPLPARLESQVPAPFVLKADWAEHKTEIGGVAVGLADVAALTAALASMTARLGHHGYVVEHMDTRPDVVELIVAARRDPAFGPVVVVGTGGVTAELDPDSAAELAPCSRETATAMLRRLRAWPLLAGWRGRAAADIDSVAEIILAVGAVLCAAPDITEVEVNPVRVAADGAIAVDALIVRD